MEKETAEILKEALRIVDDLSYIDFDDIGDQELVEKLIKRAKKMRESRLWKLK